MTIQTKNEKVVLMENGIVRVTPPPGSEYTIEDAERSLRSIQMASLGQKRPCLIDIRFMKSMNREARAYYAGEETAKIEIAAALLIDSPISRIIGNFFMGLNKPIMPTKVFTSESEAIEWLKGFL